MWVCLGGEWGWQLPPSGASLRQAAEESRPQSGLHECCVLAQLREAGAAGGGPSSWVGPGDGCWGSSPQRGCPPPPPRVLGQLAWGRGGRGEGRSVLGRSGPTVRSCCVEAAAPQARPRVGGWRGARVRTAARARAFPGGGSRQQPLTPEVAPWLRPPPALGPGAQCGGRRRGLEGLCARAARTPRGLRAERSAGRGVAAPDVAAVPARGRGDGAGAGRDARQLPSVRLAPGTGPSAGTPPLTRTPTSPRAPPTSPTARPSVLAAASSVRAPTLVTCGH